MTFHDFAIQNKFVLTKEDVPNVHYINGQTEIRFQVWMSAQENAATPPAAALVDAACELCDIASEYHAPMFSVLEPEYGELGLKLSDAIMKVRALLAAAAQTEKEYGKSPVEKVLPTLAAKMKLDEFEKNWQTDHNDQPSTAPDADRKAGE